MYQGIDFYNLAMAVSGSVWGALGSLPPTEEPRPEPPALMRIRPGRAESPGWYLVQALEFDPDDENAKVHLAIALFIAKRHAEAARHLERVLDTNPNHAAAMGSLGCPTWAASAGSSARRNGLAFFSSPRSDGTVGRPWLRFLSISAAWATRSGLDGSTESANFAFDWVYS